ncbi:hypothetical protein LINPERHAP1_LOCUS27301 [Linum perenne]
MVHVLFSMFLVGIMCFSCHVSSINDPMCEGVPDGTCRYNPHQLPDSAAYSQRSIAGNLWSAINIVDPKPIACYVVNFSGRPGGTSYSAHAYFSCNLSHDQCQACFNDAVDGMQDSCNGASGAIYEMEHCCLRYETEFPFCRS